MNDQFPDPPVRHAVDDAPAATEPPVADLGATDSSVDAANEPDPTNADPVSTDAPDAADTTSEPEPATDEPDTTGSPVEPTNEPDTSSAEPAATTTDSPVEPTNEPDTTEPDTTDSPVEPTNQPDTSSADEPDTTEPAAATTDSPVEPTNEPDTTEPAAETTNEPAPPVPEPLTGFADIGLSPAIVDSLTQLGYEEPTPIQREAIPVLLGGRDLLGQAATGTGKTASFALPILERLSGTPRGGRSGPIALVLVPTRELAVQVSEATYKYGRCVDARVVPVYGGQHIGRQLELLRRGADVVVATPGRAVDHIKRRSLPLDGIEIVVLDEADEMLDMGFAEDLDAILKATPDDRQTVLFSATMPKRIDAIARRHQHDPVRIEMGAGSTKKGAAPQVAQRAYIVSRAQKPAALGRILDVESPLSTIVFCRTRIEVDSLAETLNGRGYRSEALHGGMSQEQRDRAMGRLKNGTADLLIATDVAARGLDIDQLTHVVNYDVPSAPEAYVHRIGRVGRAGREGVAITIAEPREQHMLKNIERYTKQTVEIVDVPSVADLRARRLEHTAAIIRESLGANDLDRFLPLLNDLTVDADVREVALAALRLVHQASGDGSDEVHIPAVATRGPKKGKKFDKFDKSGKPGKFDKSAKFDKSDKSGRFDKSAKFDKAGKGAKGKTNRYAGDVTTMWIGVGRDGGVQPKDLVGAIANETRLSGRDIGAIKIQENFSLVEVPTDAADEVAWALKRTHIKGHKAKVRKDSEG